MKRKQQYLLIIFLTIVIVMIYQGSKVNAEEQVIRVAYSNASSFIMRNFGIYYGYGVEYLNEISNYTGWHYEFVECDFSDACELLKNEQIDLICTMQRSKQKEEIYDFSDYLSGWEYKSLYVLEKNTDIGYEEFEKFNGLKIGFIKNFQSNQDFETYAKEHNFSYTAFYYETPEEMENALKLGFIDALTSNSLRKNSKERMIGKYSIEPFYFAVPKGKKELLQDLNTALKKIKMENPFYEVKLQEKYYSSEQVRPFKLTVQEQTFIHSLPPLTVAYCTELGSLIYEHNGMIQGVVKELFDYISEKTGLQFIYIKTKSYQEMIQFIKNGRADLAAYMQIDSLDNININVTDSYFEVPNSVIFKEKTERDDLNIRIALHNKNIRLNSFLDEIGSNFELLYYTDSRECLKAVLDGEADFALEDLYVTENLLKEKQYKELKYNTISEFNTEIGIGIGEKSDERLLEILNKVITSISSTKRAEIITSVLANRKIIMTFKEYLLENKEEISILLLIGLSIWLGTGRYFRYRKQKELEQIAYYDQFTELRKAEKFKQDVKKILQDNMEKKQDNKDKKYVVVFFDINKFRYINTVLGTVLSNEIILLLSQLIHNSIQKNELDGRIYTDNFIALYRYDSKEALVQILENINRKFSSIIKKKQIFYKIILVEGVYLFDLEDEKGKNSEEIVEEIIYRSMLAKQSCKQGNVISFFDDKMEADMKREVEIESIMEEALQQEEFQVYYQPKYQIDEEKIIGAEALVRWKRNDGSMIYPDSFIPLFEKNGFVIQLDYYIYEQVLKWLEKRKIENRPLIRISVNLSRLHSEDVILAEHLEILAVKYGIEPKWIEFELTESALTENSQNLLDQIYRLREDGFTISIDDFGAGYSSLNLLRNVSADIIKIDKGFLDESGDSIRSSNIIKGILIMAKDINMKVVCEGVETKEQLEFLKQVHCDYVQGYYFAKPLCAKEFEQWLELKL